MTYDGAKFNLAKPNLIGRIYTIQTHKKLHNVHVVQDWVFSHWTLGVVFMVRAGISVVWQQKTHF